ncbi:hypothetical protein [Dysgonomonas sp. 25]|uniref:hypothetical protein n=1 Tax=Dysgonomonas sp. 25 TaxID=2302933 RepID=UPI0013D700C4|nr:hypothetical protein [Dysgonomonas sp. 25]NDV69288.1 hypothetical protein [Dysgonomonas sp. 25]
MKKLFYLFLLFPLLFIACSDDDNNKIKFYDANTPPERITEIEIGTRSAGEKYSFAFVKGGSGVYNTTSSNQDVIESENIWIEDYYGGYMNTLSFIIKDAGETIITVTDSKGNAATLKVTVSATSQKFLVSEPALQINDMVAGLKTAISEDVEQTNLLANNSFILTYTGKEEGNVQIYSDAYAENEIATGRFRFELQEGNQMSILFLILEYGGREHRYQYVSDNAPLSQKSNYYRIKLGENLTEYYQNKYDGQYPAGTVSEVKYYFTVSSAG